MSSTCRSHCGCDCCFSVIEDPCIESSYHSGCPDRVSPSRILNAGFTAYLSRCRDASNMSDDTTTVPNACRICGGG